MVADQLKALWDQVDRKQIAWQQYEQQKKSWLEEYASRWRRALIMPGDDDFVESSRHELIRYLHLKDSDALNAWHERARTNMGGAWDSVDPEDDKSVALFYDGCELELYNLLMWHTLAEDDAPLAYVAALEFAQSQLPTSSRRYLDFGSGVGSGGILFGRNGFDVTLGDVSSPLLSFARWRHEQRGLPVKCMDLKRESLPANSFDFITAMDVFEHLVNPVATAEQVCDSLSPGGILFGRFHIEPNDAHVTHIAKDFGPMFQRMGELGMTEVWKDQWLWGHQAFRKATRA